MAYDPSKHHRLSIRAKGFDDSEPGYYFVTICTKEKKCILGEIFEGQSRLNNYGEIVKVVWQELPNRFPMVTLDQFVIMPNHVHGIIIGGAQLIAPKVETKKGVINHAPTLGEIVRTFKALSTYQIRKTANLSFSWQRNYYDHVIRNDDDFHRIREYIVDNPAQWEFDSENPLATPQETLSNVS